MNIELVEAHALESQAMDFGVEKMSAIDAFFDAVARCNAVLAAPADAEIAEKLEAIDTRLAERLVAATEAARKTAPTAPTCAGLTLSATDGERLGRLAWTPGAR